MLMHHWIPIRVTILTLALTALLTTTAQADSEDHRHLLALVTTHSVRSEEHRLDGAGRHIRNAEHGIDDSGKHTARPEHDPAEHRDCPGRPGDNIRDAEHGVDRTRRHVGNAKHRLDNACDNSGRAKLRGVSNPGRGTRNQDQYVAVAARSLQPHR